MYISVTFKDYADGKLHHIEGIFPLSDPWWCATLFVSGRQRKRLVGCRSFKLRNDEFVMKEKVVWLFVMACMKDKENECKFREETDAFYRALT